MIFSNSNRKLLVSLNIILPPDNSEHATNLLTPIICSKIEHSKIYGPLWKSKYGPLVVVNVASADMIEQVLRQEGKHPIRTDMPHWRNYRELRNQAHGPLTE